jgi:hypothetical protein
VVPTLRAGFIISLGLAATSLPARAQTASTSISTLVPFFPAGTPVAPLIIPALYNRTYQQYPLGATKAQIKQYGPNWGLSNNPDTQDYWGYNTVLVTTDSEQADLTSRLGNGLTYMVSITLMPPTMTAITSAAPRRTPRIMA